MESGDQDEIAEFSNEENAMILNANELTPAKRAALETLLDRRVQDGEAVSLQIFEQASVSPQQRAEIVSALSEYFREVDATRKPVTDVDHEQAITEAMRSVRPGYRSHQ